MTMRTFNVILDGEVIDTVVFVGEEYTEETVKKFLCENDKMDRGIEVKLVREVRK